jgi:uncharacterized metal-binding protein
MPSGKIHTALTLSVLSGVAAPYLLVNLEGNVYYYLLGNLAGILLTPDHDVDAGNFTDTIIRKVSPAAQRVWRLFWTPYAKALPHRGKFSHFPVLSTLVRLGYILIAINMVNLVIRLILSFFGVVDTVFLWWWSWSFFWGLVHVDTIHYLADRLIKGKEQFIDE